MRFVGKSLLCGAIFWSCAVAVRAQEVAPVVAMADRFIKANPLKDLHIVFHQPCYVPGDTAFYGFFSGSKDLSKSTRKILNMDVVDKNGERVIGQKVSLITNQQKGSLVLPGNIKPGLYTVAIYPDWMANMSPSLFLTAPLYVAGDAEADKQEQPVLVFAEGGALIAGLSGTIVFYTPTAGVHSAHIVNSSEQVVASGVPNGGFGEITFTPFAGERYRLKVASSDKPVSYTPLPEIQTSGLAIHRHPGEKGIVAEVYQKGIESKVSAVWCTNEGVVSSVSVQFGDDGNATLRMPRAVINGYTQLVLLDDAGRVLAQRWFYVAEDDFKHGPIGIHLPDRVETRSEVSVTLDLPADVSRAAVRVVHRGLFGGNVDKPADTAYVDAVNRALVTRSYSMLPEQPLPAAVEKRALDNTYQYLHLSGRAVFAETDKPVPDSTRIMFFLQEQAFGYETITRADGSFELPLVYDVYGKSTVFYAASLHDRDMQGIKITWNSDAAPATQTYPLSASSLPHPGNYAEYMQRKRLIDASFQYFARRREPVAEDPNLRFEEELGGVDISKETKDYVPFQTMSELVREILPAVEHRKIHDRNIIRVYTHKRPTNYTGPLYIIDGVLTKDTEKFLSLNPADVISIKVVKDGVKLRHFGALADHGIILVRTRLEPNSFRQENTFIKEGFSQEGISEVYKGKVVRGVRVPDFRPCLYFNPEITADASGKATFSFNTADDLGEYSVEVTGFSKTGEVFEARQPINVVFGLAKP